MPLEQEVIHWAATRLPWQQQILGRIARGDTLTDSDYEQVVEAIIRLRYTVSFGLDSLDAGSGGLGLAGVGWEEAEQGRSSDSMR